MRITNSNLHHTITQVFTRWLNKKLMLTKIQIKDIVTDWQDGHALLALMEVLSGKQGPHNKMAKVCKIRMQKVRESSIIRSQAQRTCKAKVRSSTCLCCCIGLSVSNCSNQGRYARLPPPFWLADHFC